MASLVFLIHGMGDHPDGWSTPIQTRLQSLANDLRPTLAHPRPLTIGPSGSEVEVCEIAYDEVFRAEHARNARSANSLLAALKKTKVIDAVERTFDWLATTGPENEEFFLTHVADVVLFRGLPLLRRRIVTLVAERIASRITSTLAALPPAERTLEVSVIAHSLGTAVTQQALEQLATTPVLGKRGLMLPWRFQSISMLANVSRILERDDVYRSVVGPAGRGTLGWNTQQYLSFRHELDPFTLVRTFDPPPAWQDPLYLRVAPLQHLLLFNVHDYEHYLVHPAVHLNVFNAIWNANLFSPAVIAQAVAAYAPAPPTPCLAEVATARAEFTRIARSLQASPDLATWLRGITEMLVIAHRLAKACPAGARL